MIMYEKEIFQRFEYRVPVGKRNEKDRRKEVTKRTVSMNREGRRRGIRRRRGSRSRRRRGRRRMRWRIKRK